MYDSVIGFSRCCVCGLGENVTYVEHNFEGKRAPLMVDGRKQEIIFSKTGQLFTCTECRKTFHKACMPEECCERKLEY